jgi:TatD DNase family protein
VAVGESGLDFYRTGAPAEVQERAFADHIALAKERDKALVIHTRDSLDAALEMLERVGAPDRLVFHCWSGEPDRLRRALDTGAFISFAGNVSYPSADDLREAAGLVPGHRLLVETDSPFLAPVPRRGRPNEPANVAYVGAAVAEARNETVEDVAAITTSNAERLFGV